MSDVFQLKDEEYDRDLNVLATYQRDSAFYLSRMTGRPFEQCLQYVREVTAPDGDLPVKDPIAYVLSKEKPGTRSQLTMPFSEYLKAVQENGYLMSPTMAVYFNPEQKESLLSRYISGNIKKRNLYKKQMFEAKMAGDEVMELLKFNEQTSAKIKNNSLSGAHNSPYTILYNKSAHSTLTSTCRNATGYGNANNEKLLAGNRHYWAPDVVKANIVSIVNNTDLFLLDEAMFEFGIRPPTVEETMECIRRSTDLYWRSEKEMAKIRRLVETLSDVERAAFVYVGDLYHLAKYNDQVVRKFLDELSTPATEPIDNPDEYLDSLDGDAMVLVKYLCSDLLAGRSLEKLKEEDPRAYGIIGATAKEHLRKIHKYALMIRALLVTKNVPASVASLPTIIRRLALASDTDSTIFTVQDWVEWFVGEINFSKKAGAIRDVMGYLSSKTIAHILKIMMAQMGVAPERRHMLSMKNEYTFPVFSLTSRSKHYYAFRSAQEGNVFSDYDMEIKGVALRNSNSPPRVTEKTRSLLDQIMRDTIAGKKLSAYAILKDVGDLEREIRDSVLAGKYEYFKTSQIKPLNSYKNPDNSPYSHYLLWEEVFAPKYGSTEPPTYSAIKVSLAAHNPTALKKWVDRIEDRALADRLQGWLNANKRRDLTTILLPESIVAASGVPVEVIAGVDIRKLIIDTMEPLYLILESLGFYIKDPHIARLVSDYY